MSFYSCFSWLSLLLFPTEGLKHFYLFLLQGFIISIYSFSSFLSAVSIPALGFRHIFIYCCFRVLSYFLFLLEGFIIFIYSIFRFFFLTSGFYYIHHVFLIQGFIIMYHFRVLSYIHVFLLQGFIKTIPDLIEGLDKIRGIVNTQRKITQAFGEGFDQCESCG